MATNQKKHVVQSQFVSRILVISAAIGVIGGVQLSECWGFPVQGQYQDNPALCDILPTQNFAHELGDVTFGFPIDEGLQVVSTPTPQLACVGDDGVPNDYLVLISNISPYAYKDLFFVVDDGGVVGNADGAITDLAAPGFTDAFKIDNVGVNSNLVFGDLNNNLIFEPGETWEFLVTNFFAPATTPPFPQFGSVGGFAASSASDPISNASILANRVPEPATVTVLVGISLLLASCCSRLQRDGGDSDQ